MRSYDLGRAGEAFACDYLTAHGYEILHRNYRSGHLETDIICENDTHILFVEVKSRTDRAVPSRFGRPAAAVDFRKRVNIKACAEQYIYEKKPNKKPRIDVIEVYLTAVGDTFVLSPRGIHHIENALM